MKRNDFALMSLPVAVLSVALITITAGAQTPVGVISGRIAAEDGQPIPHAKVRIAPLDRVQRWSGGANLVADNEGKFQAEGLDAGPYTIDAVAPGYVLQPETVDSLHSSKYYFLGDVATLTMIKGGVITGRVLDAAGKPIISVIVQATQIIDEQGRPVDPHGKESSDGVLVQRQTDDRGIYRLYGFAPGSYIVSAGRSGLSTRPKPFDGRMLIYYPSAPRAAAAKVTVRSGEEVSGIDIRYRSERGASISGRVGGAPPPDGKVRPPITISLRQAGTETTIGNSYMQNDGSGYVFYGLPDGDYEVLAADHTLVDEVTRLSPPRRVTLRGRDVSGVDLILSPLASIAGTVLVEKGAADAQTEGRRRSQLSEVVVRVRRDELNERGVETSPSSDRLHLSATSTDGTFLITGLQAGRHRFLPLLPDDDWYIKTIKQIGAVSTPVDISHSGMILKSGERVTGVKITVATGAAAIRGKITAADGAKISGKARVHLAPRGPERREEALRYAEVMTDGEGVFAFTNLAPGKYWLLAQPVLDGKPSESFGRPVAWDPVERARLSKAAEMGGVMIELNPGDRVIDYRLPYKK